jgi:amidohydrolase
MNARKDVVSINPEIIQWRHELHSCPETAFEEFKTADYLAEKLSSFGLKVERGLAKTGLVASVTRGSTNPDQSIALRADMDGLNITEENTFEYCSQHAGKMHACGHDGHMAMLLGAARILSQSDNFKGTVHFIFQPAEEHAGGGNVMVQEGLFEKFPVKAVFGMHNFPTMPVGEFAIKSGPIMAAVDIFDVIITGAGGHGAMPHSTKDPIVGAAQLINSLQTIVSRNIDPADSSVFSITAIHGGTAHNIIPEQVTLRGTIRHFKKEVQKTVRKRMEQIISGVASAMDLKIELDYQPHYPALVNTEKETMQAIDAAAATVGKDKVDTEMTPLMGSEDFSYMVQKRPGAYICIGGGVPGSPVNLHQSKFDFNDEILALGTSYWLNLVERLLPV